MAGGLPHPVLLSTFCNMDQITIGGQVVEFKHVFYSWVCMAVLFVVAYLVRRRLTLVPGGMQNFFEALIDTIENFICNTMGEAGRRFVPLLAGMFIYIFGMNLLGLIPGFDAPTANLNTTVSMALFVLVFYNALGIIRWKAHYVHHFTGPSKFLIPLMFPLEIVSHLSRPVSLSLRLFGNIRGEEIVMVLFFIMAPISPLPLRQPRICGEWSETPQLIQTVEGVSHAQTSDDRPEHRGPAGYGFHGFRRQPA